MSWNTNNKIDYGMCMWRADGTMIYPKNEMNNELEIRLFQNCENTLKYNACSELLSEFSKEFEKMNITNAEQCKIWVGNNWTHGNGFMVASLRGQFIGTIAIDFKTNVPFISNLLIAKNLRNKGYGKRLLKYGEKYSRELGYDEVYLWCKDELLPFYNKLEWKKIDNIKQGDQFVNVMKKTI